MSGPEEFQSEYDADAFPLDLAQENARGKIEQFINDNSERIFFSRQIEVLFERDFFHWVTNRAIRDLEAVGKIRSEMRPLKTGGSIKLLWHSSYRYYRRGATEVVRLVEEYANPNIGGALGRHGELMVLEGFAKNRFLMAAQNTRQYGGRAWTRSDHDLDFIFERDGRAYGVEVKNTLGYMDHEEFSVKIALSEEIGVIPVFVARMLPKVWVHEVVQKGGFALILKFQLYPLSHKELARRISRGTRFACRLSEGASGWYDEALCGLARETDVNWKRDSQAGYHK